jgi:hypothetical protein
LDPPSGVEPIFGGAVVAEQLLDAIFEIFGAQV